MRSIGTIVKAIRKRSGKTQVEFAAALGTSGNTVSRWERDAMKPAGISLAQLISRAEGDDREALVREMNLLGNQPDARSSPAVIALVNYMADIFQPETAAALRALYESQHGGAIADILSLWEQHKDNWKALKHFRDAAAFLRVQLMNIDKEDGPPTGRESPSEKEEPKP
jgi:transcriptional regulator with XRE-family HTH domain